MDFFNSTKHTSSFFVFLERMQHYPGDTLRGVVEIAVEAPLYFTTLQACVLGEETTRFGTSLTKRIDTETRYTTFYRQNVILAGDPPNPETRSASEEDFSDVWSDNGGNFMEGSGAKTVVTKGLMPGTYSFPFSVRLPDVLPPSYVDHRNTGSSKLSYEVRAKLFAGSRVLAKHRVYFSLKMPPLNPKRWIKAHMDRGFFFITPSKSAVATDDGTEASESNTGSKTVLIDHQVSLESAMEPGRQGGEGSSCSNNFLGSTFQDATAKAFLKNTMNNWPSPVSAHENSRSEGTDGNSGIIIPGGNEHIAGKRTCEHVLERTEGNPGAHPSPSAFLKENSSWEHHLEVPVYGVFKRGVVDVFLIVHQIIGTRGSQIRFRAIVDNTRGGSCVTKVKFQIVSHITMRSHAEEQDYRSVLTEKVLHENISREENHGIAEMELVLPGNTPLTLFTPGYSCRTFLEVKLSYSQGLLTQSGSAGVEIAIVDRFTDSDSSRLLKHWTNRFLGRELGKNVCTSPDIICPFVKNGAMKVIQEECEREVDPLLSSHSSTSTAHGGTKAPGRRHQRHRLNFDEVAYYARAMDAPNPLLTIPWDARIEVE
ncbi:hypothetical protein C3747_109g110 [Trypanosoma cruzi]|uniref:Uncharacterized protein n=2 Tax=Trypanosoma cruzi TaxID=5693 RepID=Q4DLG7_TRYCC|nr:hypothetical protein, conserved [Trypanosoma cruzi]EAN93375.1 hypothetical protein, conserved [Trypanosoma cruzi]PWV06889.1 hypothetical protein C3747_109g110 [Trypanosoma cruzi]|eukprot:XP_815226.1 hypothetical protein [Trypanosoma cruzi strain CL Brener]